MFTFNVLHTTYEAMMYVHGSCAREEICTFTVAHLMGGHLPFTTNYFKIRSIEKIRM